MSRIAEHDAVEMFRSFFEPKDDWDLMIERAERRGDLQAAANLRAAKRRVEEAFRTPMVEVQGDPFLNARKAA